MNIPDAQNQGYNNDCSNDKKLNISYFGNKLRRAKLETYVFIHNKVLFKKTIFCRAKLIKKYRKDSSPIKFEKIVI